MSKEQRLFERMELGEAIGFIPAILYGASDVTQHLEVHRLSLECHDRWEEFGVW